MKYLLLIYGNEGDWATMSEEEQGKSYQEYMEYTQDIYKKGQYIAGEALQPIATATTVRVKNGKTLTTDGPFAETREQLGGFYMVEAKDLDEAISLAARIPSARHGSIEVRPIMPTPAPATIGA
ncbi:MAG TPA: YciI family protein [Candidatus Polarisedimenticolaceae bacterium]|nr:YciI family protein [Candidatus Polarisedimenticolaceae bacterium]